MERFSRALMAVVGCLLAVQSVMGADTLVLVVPGLDPNSAPGVRTIEAVFNGSGYDDIVVEIWGRDPGQETSSTVLGYQVMMVDALPSAGCAGDVRWVAGSGGIDESDPNWLHAGYTGFTTIADGVELPYAVLVSARMPGQSTYPVLGSSAKYLGHLSYSIAQGAAGTWLVRPFCRISDYCVAEHTCTRSGTSCDVDGDCPRYAILDDLTDTCEAGILLDDGTFFHTADEPNFPRFDVQVEALEIVIPVGQCCVGDTCLGDLTAEDCQLAAGVWDPTRQCGVDPCPCQGLDCTYLDSDCTRGVCNPANDTCEAQIINEGEDCTVDDAVGVCVEGGCFVSVSCNSDVDCVLSDNDACTWDRCGTTAAGLCDTPIPAIYGDICGETPTDPPNGQVNFTDLLCLISAYGPSNLARCPNADIADVVASQCPSGNGVVDLTDVLKLIDALGAPDGPHVTYFCDCPLNR